MILTHSKSTGSSIDHSLNIFQRRYMEELMTEHGLKERNGTWRSIAKNADIQLKKVKYHCKTLKTSCTEKSWGNCYISPFTTARIFHFRFAQSKEVCTHQRFNMSKWSNVSWDISLKQKTMEYCIPEGQPKIFWAHLKTLIGQDAEKHDSHRLEWSIPHMDLQYPGRAPDKASSICKPKRPSTSHYHQQRKSCVG